MTDVLRDLTDRLAIRATIDRYAHHADRREPVEQASVFTEDGRVRLFAGDPARSEPVDTIVGRAALAETFAALIARYDTTTYLNGQCTIDLTDDDAASAETYCLALHLLHDAGERVLLTMSIRYLDRLVRAGDGWLIADRTLIIDWTDRRPSTP